MPTPYPKEFRRDVVAVARQGDQSRAQVARSFGIAESCLARWLRIADREDGAPPASSEPSGSGLEAENRELRNAPNSWSRRMRSCVGRRPTSPATLSQNDDRRRWQTRQQLRLAIITWIENTYHRRRRQDTLGRLTPIEFETIQQAATAA